jgi:hypothetical protein
VEATLIYLVYIKASLWNGWFHAKREFMHCICNDYNDAMRYQREYNDKHYEDNSLVVKEVWVNLCDVRWDFNALRYLTEEELQ